MASLQDRHCSVFWSFLISMPHTLSAQIIFQGTHSLFQTMKYEKVSICPFRVGIVRELSRNTLLNSYRTRSSNKQLQYQGLTLPYKQNFTQIYLQDLLLSWYSYSSQQKTRVAECLLNQRGKPSFASQVLAKNGAYSFISHFEARGKRIAV